MNNKKIYIGAGSVLIICVLVVGGYLFIGSRPVTSEKIPSPVASSTTALDPLNATYIIDGSSVALINGRAMQRVVPDSAEIITTQIFGVPVTGDVNNDGVNDAALILTQTGAGSGSFYYAAAALATKNGTVGTNAIFLGDRIAPDTTQVANGIITVNYAVRRSADPMTVQPSVGISKYLVVAGTALYDTPTDIYPLPSDFLWNAAHATTILPDNENVPSALVGIKIMSRPITNITDLTMYATPFDAYYKTKLTAAGWTEDNTLAAGGPGAEIVGYKKGDNYIILEYTSVFKNNGGGNSPETCPCDMTFSIFAGTVK